MAYLVAGVVVLLLAGVVWLIVWGEKAGKAKQALEDVTDMEEERHGSSEDYRDERVRLAARWLAHRRRHRELHDREDGSDPPA